MNYKKNKMDKLNKDIVDKYCIDDIVLGDGRLDSRIILVGEAPGAKEVEYKKPFVGKAGGNLKEFLSILEINREDVYITNVVKFRPTKLSSKTNGKINRPPTTVEINEFKDFLYKELEIISPIVIVTLGNTPLKSILNDNIKIGDVHGIVQTTSLNGHEYKVFPLYHPAAIIYKRDLKTTYLSDLEKLRAYLKI